MDKNNISLDDLVSKHSDVLAYMYQACKEIMREQEFVPQSEAEFSDWYDKNFQAIGERAKELILGFWLRFAENGEKRDDRNITYEQALIETMCRRVYYKLRYQKEE